MSVGAEIDVNYRSGSRRGGQAVLVPSSESLVSFRSTNIDLNLSKIISFITSRGFQIHPDALVLIENTEGEMIQIVEEIL